MSVERLPANRRARILAVAARSFAANGYGATTMAEIQRASGASTGSLYHHFPSREHVAATLWIESLSTFQAGFLEALDGPAPAKRGVVESLRFYGRWVEEDPHRARFLLAPRDPRVLELTAHWEADENREFFDAVRRWYDGHGRGGRVRELPWGVLTAIWLGPSQQHSRVWLERQSGAGPVAVGDALAEAAWRSLRYQRGA